VGVAIVFHAAQGLDAEGIAAAGAQRFGIGVGRVAGIALALRVPRARGHAERDSPGRRVLGVREAVGQHLFRRSRLLLGTLRASGRRLERWKVEVFRVGVDGAAYDSLDLAQAVADGAVVERTHTAPAHEVFRAAIAEDELFQELDRLFPETG